jgi:putative endonuclease
MKTNSYYVYILSSSKNGMLYTGVTNDFVRRVFQHKSGVISGFTKRYKTYNLVYYEVTPDIYSAITREKRIKKWRRSWKIELIENSNPEWRDLYTDII